MDLKLDEHNKTPVYQQIVNRVTQLVHSGAWRSGTAVPSERELAQRLGVARGTVARAYAELTRARVLAALPGAARRVAGPTDPELLNRKERVLQQMRTLAHEAQAQRFTLREIQALFSMVLQERRARRRQLCLAVVDSRSEILDLFGRQLGFMARIQVARLPWTDLAHDVAAERRLAAFDLVVAADECAEDLLQRVPSVAERLLKVSAALSQPTVVRLASLSSAARLGLLCESEGFRDLVQRKLTDFSVAAETLDTLLHPAADLLAAFLAAHDVLIVPPHFSLLPDRTAAAAMQAFRERGGQIVVFEYAIERGSLDYVEERARAWLLKEPPESTT